MRQGRRKVISGQLPLNLTHQTLRRPTHLPDLPGSSVEKRWLFLGTGKTGSNPVLPSHRHPFFKHSEKMNNVLSFTGLHSGRRTNKSK